VVVVVVIVVKVHIVYEIIAGTTLIAMKYSPTRRLVTITIITVIIVISERQIRIAQALAAVVVTITITKVVVVTQMPRVIMIVDRRRAISPMRSRLVISYNFGRTSARAVTRHYLVK
jgi:hypothetical protein